METIIRHYTETKNGFQVIQKGNIIQSLNKLNEVFHEIDTTYLKEGIIFHGWIGYRTNDQIKEVLDGHFIELYQKYKCKKMLIENTKMTGTFADINDWLGQYFMPKMVKEGLAINAVILPFNLFAKIAVDDWDHKVGGFHSRNFDNLDKGLQWLRTI